MINTRAQLKILHSWIISIIVEQRLVQIGRIDGSPDYKSQKNAGGGGTAGASLPRARRHCSVPRGRGALNVHGPEFVLTRRWRGEPCSGAEPELSQSLNWALSVNCPEFVLARRWRGGAFQRRAQVHSRPMVTLRVTVLVVICSRGQPCIGCQPGGGLGLEDALPGAAPRWSEEQEDEEAGAAQNTPNCRIRAGKTSWSLGTSPIRKRPPP